MEGVWAECHLVLVLVPGTMRSCWLFCLRCNKGYEGTALLRDRWLQNGNSNTNCCVVCDLLLGSLLLPLGRDSLYTVCIHDERIKTVGRT